MSKSQVRIFTLEEMCRFVRKITNWKPLSSMGHDDRFGKDPRAYFRGSIDGVNAEIYKSGTHFVRQKWGWLGIFWNWVEKPYPGKIKLYSGELPLEEQSGFEEVDEEYRRAMRLYTEQEEQTREQGIQTIKEAIGE
jgi:hypothetical protein